jgi:hypothetical protein
MSRNTLFEAGSGRTHFNNYSVSEFESLPEGHCGQGPESLISRLSSLL